MPEAKRSLNEIIRDAEAQAEEGYKQIQETAVVNMGEVDLEIEIPSGPGGLDLAGLGKVRTGPLDFDSAWLADEILSVPERKFVEPRAGDVNLGGTPHKSGDAVNDLKSRDSEEA